jgi:hypothetical protein
MILMDNKLIVGVAIIIAILGVGAFAFGMHHNSPTSKINSTTYNNNVNTTTTNQTATNSSKVLFSSTQYFPYSYLVYPGLVSQQAQSAMAGFNLTSNVLQNNTTEVKISITGTNQYQSIMLKPNYKLYIIETSFGDDGFHYDSSLADDGFVVVDQNGYIA